ncbi:MAG: hypothetical protein Q9163_000803 [Psora crenata]
MGPIFTINKRKNNNNQPGESKSPSANYTKPNVDVAASIIRTPTDPVADRGISGDICTNPNQEPFFWSNDGIINRRRGDTATGSSAKTQLPHLQINLAQAQKQFHEPTVQPLPDETRRISPSQTPTAPITIPQPKHNRPTTPLTGRPQRDGSSDCYFNRALWSKRSSWGSQSFSDRSLSPVQAMDSRPEQQPNHYYSSSPLSPSKPISIPRNEPQHKEKRLQPNLNLGGLPKFHPLNFPNSDSNTPLSPRSARAVSSQSRNNRLGSEPKQKLHHRQRNVIDNAPRTAHSTPPQGTTVSPDSPRLAPRRSPAGPVTPMMLEAPSQGDYIMAGSGLSPSNAASGRDLVEKLVQKENQRRLHPEAAPMGLSPNVSPAVVAGSTAAMSATEGARCNSQDWEDWMDWGITARENAEEEAKETPKYPLNHACQLPSPEGSPTSEPPPSQLSRKCKASNGSEQHSQTAKRPSRKEAQRMAQNKSHSIVEKRYRTNLNQKIADLSSCLPILRGNAEANEEVVEGESLLKHNKATVLAEAIAYIKRLERRNVQLEQANRALQEESRKRMSEHIPAQDEMEMEEASHSSTENAEVLDSSIGEDGEAASEPVQGMIQVPEEWRRLWKGELTPYSAEPEVVSNGTTEGGGGVSVRGGKYVGRLLVGSLAGLMVMDSFAGPQKEDSNDRGLFSLPILRHLPNAPRIRIEAMWPAVYTSWRSFPHYELLAPLIKCFLVFCVLGLMLFIYLFNSRPPARKHSSTLQLQPTTSRASPLAVRQRAWLTSIQTVWVPRHHVFPEMLALVVETAAYLIRQVLGWQLYSWLTGRSEHEEIGRVRAWDIAIDAQLSGGDPEISKSRLVLTLWASGTLPSTPARLMLKALHIRVLFWQTSRIPWLTFLMHEAARRLASWQWERAYRMQRKSEAAGLVESEPLSDHLKALLPLGSDNVMIDAVIQRAHNLLWNTSISECPYVGEVMEDTAMRGPLDALASWSSSVRLAATLRAAMNSGTIAQDSYIIHQLDLATATSPHGSLEKAKALAAKVVLCDHERNEQVRQLIQALAPTRFKEEDVVRTMSSTFMALLADLPCTDAYDIAASARCALAMDRLQYEVYNSRAAFMALRLLETSQIGAPSLGLLGFTAAHQLSLVLRRCEKRLGVSVGEGELKGRIRSLISSLEEPTSARVTRLDTQTRNHIASAFKRLIAEEGKARRYSNTSYDTGYDSMTDDEGCASRL